MALPSPQCPESVDFRNVSDGILLNTQVVSSLSWCRVGMLSVGLEGVGVVVGGGGRRNSSCVCDFDIDRCFSSLCVCMHVCVCVCACVTMYNRCLGGWIVYNRRTYGWIIVKQ